MDKWYNEQDLQKQGYQLLEIVPFSRQAPYVCSRQFQDMFDSILICRTFDTFDREIEKTYPEIHLWSRNLKGESLAVFGQPRDPVAQWHIIYAALREKAWEELMWQIEDEREKENIAYNPNATFDPTDVDYEIIRPTSYREYESNYPYWEKEEQERVWDETWRRDYESQRGGAKPKPQVPTKKPSGRQGIEDFV